MSQFDFLPDRSNTGSIKWDKYANTDIIPMWVADMDFRSADCINQALSKAIDFSVYGYVEAKESCANAFLNYVAPKTLHDSTVCKALSN